MDKKKNIKNSIHSIILKLYHSLCNRKKVVIMNIIFVIKQF